MAANASTEKGGKGNGTQAAPADEKKKTYKASPFRGVLDRLIEDHRMKVELGMAKDDDDIAEIVSDKTTGDVYAVSVKRVRKGGDKA